ncbi:hypothetical protein [Lederbergia citrea]|uniref:Uncharacterized protein n=1 Tax=Lederbergia citrea TaxID=2833581 RepID=A0A942UN81_9BACI|nr:hypothetical protein [Lederbergia citrea]MBS4206010.1 hypothetical protein [Lederbergia citrea]MBS4224541.1 hypothetical protein [Lederbergia citrea]
MPNKKTKRWLPTRPHFDGELENVINDPTATESTQMGINMNIDSANKPFHVTDLKSEDMKEFEQLTRGNPINDKID